MRRIILFFLLAIPAGGFSALQWLKRYVFSRAMNLQDFNRVRYAFGIDNPAATLQQAWSDLRHGRPTGDKAWSFELFKNVLAEWAKLDAHRAAFFLSLVILFWVMVSLALAIALILVVLL